MAARARTTKRIIIVFQFTRHPLFRGLAQHCLRWVKEKALVISCYDDALLNDYEARKFRNFSSPSSRGGGETIKWRENFDKERPILSLSRDFIDIITLYNNRRVVTVKFIF